MVRSGPYPVIRLAALLAGGLLLSSCGGRTEPAPVEYIGGGQPSSSGVITGGGGAEPLPEIEAAPLAPVSRGGGITATPLDSAPSAPVDAAPAPPSATPATPSGAEAAAAGGTTVVGRGESLSAVSRRTGVPLRDLILANNLSAPFSVQPGQVLQLPQVRYHTVVAGDTVYNISRRYGVDQASLMAENGISPPFTVKLGQQLRIPGRVEAAPTAAVAPAVAAPPVDEPAAPLPEIIEPDPDSLPPPKPATSNAVSPEAGDTAALSSPPATATVPQVRRKPAPPVAATATTAATVPARPGTASAAAPPASGMRFLWPVAGDVISEFGSKPGGQHNDGINIQAAQGTSVRAAESGVVAYAGNEIRGFGNLVLIRHDGGWMTAYAHNATLLVKQGDKVVRGQQIARVGHTGNVTVPQLHFEVRKGRTPVDPLKYLEGSAG